MNSALSWYIPSRVLQFNISFNYMFNFTESFSFLQRVDPRFSGTILENMDISSPKHFLTVQHYSPYMLHIKCSLPLELKPLQHAKNAHFASYLGPICHHDDIMRCLFLHRNFGLLSGPMNMHVLAVLNVEI